MQFIFTLKIRSEYTIASLQNMNDISVLAIEITRLEQYPGSAYANEYMYSVYVAIIQASHDTVGTVLI